MLLLDHHLSIRTERLRTRRLLLQIHRVRLAVGTMPAAYYLGALLQRRSLLQDHRQQRLADPRHLILPFNELASLQRRRSVRRNHPIQFRLKHLGDSFTSFLTSSARGHGSSLNSGFVLESLYPPNRPPKVSRTPSFPVPFVALDTTAR